MKFEAKRKALSAAVATVKSLHASLSVASADSTSSLFLLTENKTLHVRSIQGSQVIDSVVDDVVIHEDGVVKVDPAGLSAALSLSGDLFKAEVGDNRLEFTCGRAKAYVGLMGETDMLECKIPKDIPKPTLRVLCFKQLLGAVKLSAIGSTDDRTLHFDTTKVRSEGSDGFRGVTAVTKLMDGDKAEPKSLSLPAKAVDAIAAHADSAVVGYDDNVFVVKAPGLFVCMPQSSSQPMEIVTQLKEWLESQTELGSFVVSTKEIISALDDAIAIVGTKVGDTRMSVTFSSKGGFFKGEAESSAVQTDFDIVSGPKDEIAASIVPAYLKEIFSFYKKEQQIRLSVYSGALVINLTVDDNTLVSQTTSLPLNSLATFNGKPLEEGQTITREPVKEEPKAEEVKEEAPVKKSKAKAVETDDTPEAPKPKKVKSDVEEKATVATPKPEEKVKVKLPPVEEEEDDEEDFDDEE